MILPPPRFITVFGLGGMRPASGTWGSLPPVLLAAALFALGYGPAAAPILYNGLLLAVCIFFCLACVLEGDRAEAHFREKDPANAVADETAGQCLPLLFFPAILGPWHTALLLLLAFLFFRLFDILKPFPAKQLQRIPGGWGILIDDLFAGLYAAILIQLLGRFLLA